MDCSLPGSSVYGICQARLLEWVAISFSRGSSWPRDKTYASCIGRGILYHSATREALMYLYISYIFMLERGKSFYSRMRHWCLVWYLGQSSYLGNCSWETLSVRFYASGRQISRLISSLKFLSYCVRGAVWCLLLLCVRHQYFFMFSKTLSASPSVRFIKFLVTVGTLGNTVSSHVNLQPLKGVRGSQMGQSFPETYIMHILKVHKQRRIVFFVSTREIQNSLEFFWLSSCWPLLSFFCYVDPFAFIGACVSAQE